MGYEIGRAERGFLTGTALLLMVLAPAATARAQSATQSVRMEIRPINQLAVRGTTAFIIPARPSGVESVAVASASYAVTTNEDNRRITVAIDEPMPEGVTLTMRMDAPSGAQTQDALTLSTVPQVAVTGISRLNAKDLGISFSLKTGSNVRVPATTTRTVRITLVSAA
jgi:hypothetical protein